MAQVALAKNCPECGSLLTFAGRKADPTLTANCFVCKTNQETANHEYVEPTAEDASSVVALQAHAKYLQSEIDGIKAQLAKSPAVVVGEKPVDNPVLPDAETPDTSGSSASGE